MPFAERRLTNPTTLSTVASTVYTVPAQYTTIVKQVVVTNTTASPASFNLYIGSATAANAIFSNTTVSANDSVVINLSQVLSSLEILTASANANSAINITISGVDNNGPLDPATVYIADGAITTSRLANASVTTDKLAANSVATVAIASNAVTQAKLSTDVPLSGMRNVLINGDFKIWQRGTLTFDGTAYRYTADRWQAVRGGFAAGQSLTRQTASLDGFQYCTRVARDSGNTSTAILYLAQTVETANSIQFQNKPVTLSFYARAGANYSAASSALNVRVATGTGTDQNHFNGGFSNETNIIDSNVTLTTTWQRFFLYGSAASTTTQLGLTFLFTPVGTAGAADYFEITGVQLEQGTQPTPFEQRPIGVELTLCQRYYQRVGTTASDSGQYMYFASGWLTGSVLGTGFPLRVDMRSTPAVATSGVNTFYIDAATGFGAVNALASINHRTAQSIRFQIACAGTAGQSAMLLSNGTATAFFTMDAEL